MHYLYLARTGYLRNTAYMWSHLLNNLASTCFGIIYLALWSAVASPLPGPGGYTRATLLGMVILSQTLAWTNAFLPAGLGIQSWVRTGEIALQMAKPIPFFSMVMVRELGSISYQFIYRSLPVGLVLGLYAGWPAPDSAASLLLFIPSALLGMYVALALFYTIGLASLWTTEIRWAHWAYHSALTLLSGGWIPADLLPGWLGRVAPELPFAAQLFYPVRIYLGLSGAEVILKQLAWAAILTLWCSWLTRRALDRVVVQGG